MVETTQTLAFFLVATMAPFVAAERILHHTAVSAPKCADAEVIANDIRNKFQRGELIVHTKRNFRNPSRTLKRWENQHFVDKGLSFSMLHAKMPLQNLWTPTGYIFDALKCDTVIGYSEDLWVNNMIQNGAEKTLDTFGGRRAEVLRLMWLHSHCSKNPVQVLSSSLGDDFVEWATNPDKWTPLETDTFTAQNGMIKASSSCIGASGIPTADDLRRMLNAIQSGSSKVHLVGSFEEMSVGIVKSYNTMDKYGDLRKTFTEVLTACPLESILGYVSSKVQAEATFVFAPDSFQVPEGLGGFFEAYRKLMQLQQQANVVETPEEEAAVQKAFGEISQILEEGQSKVEPMLSDLEADVTAALKADGPRVLSAIREEIPCLADEPLVVAQYMPIEGEEAQAFEDAVASARTGEGHAVSVEWKPEWLAKLDVTVHMPASTKGCV